MLQLDTTLGIFKEILKCSMLYETVLRENEDKPTLII
jgi:hypothetical protein